MATMTYGGPEAAAFRREQREWIEGNAPDGLRELFDWRSHEVAGNWIAANKAARDTPEHRLWEERCVAAGLVCPSWPESVGGRGWTRVHKAIFEEELHRAGVPRIDRGMGEFLLGPTIVACGTEEQQARLLPPIIAGEHRYCQGFSEPDAGSDLAGLRTRGVVEGDELVITGQKVWTSHALEANMMFLLCRTDPAAPKHKGLSFVVMPFGPENGVELSPIVQMTGGSDFGQEFLTESRTSLTNVIGGLNEGWRVTMTTLGFERDFNLPTISLEFLHEHARMRDRLRDRAASARPGVRQAVAKTYTEAAIVRLFAQRMLADPEGSADMVSMTKLFWSEFHRHATETELVAEGPAALVRPAGEGYPTTTTQDSFLAARSGTIFAGTSQIQRNIIAERVLGLPR
ncbi:acyl-CoA dehydrogenase family protein [Pseudonocardia sp. NPDC049154]|uniref:acyl-CoA dehydrogenase family protein n=1 Tax=Pseudonocardia sp. NPDC049154 TaxID=3155501 RepID=UPI0033CF99D4